MRISPRSSCLHLVVLGQQAASLTTPCRAACPREVGTQMRHDTGTFVLALREAPHHPGQVPSHLLPVTAGKQLVGKSSAVQSTCAATTGKGHRALATYVLCKQVKGKANWTGCGGA